MIRLTIVAVFSCCSLWSMAQTDTLQGSGEVTVSASKWEQKMNEVPNKITKVSKKDILLLSPQTSADLLAQTGTVFVQKSQLGGGSPMIRGFATNRVLLVIDGVRMNNAIFRSGNLQNVISIDALSTETAEVVFGPGSLIYGSDAIGGVMDFHSLEAKLQQKGAQQLLAKGSGLLRYSTANQEKTAHADVSIGGQKWAYLGSVSFSSFGDLTMGKYGGQDGYLRKEYVERINGKDSIVQNTNPRTQVHSGYNQWNTVQKLRFRPSDGVDLQYAFYYSGTGNAPRYDRLIEYRNGNLRFAEWDYGPMLWRMHSLQAALLKRTAIYDEAKIIVAYQNYEESRIDRQRNNLNRRNLEDQVKMFTANIDAVKELGKGAIFYGAELVTNLVRSTGFSTNIQTNASTTIASRYPNGSTWRSAGLYGSYRLNFHPQFTFSTGLRYNHASVQAAFNNQFFPFPYQKASIRDGGVTGNMGLVYRPAISWQLNANIATGFRVPNIDDIGKLFESTPGNLTVPNPNLRSEYAWNFELGAVKHVQHVVKLELNLFHTRLQNAIVRRPFTFNGQDSVLYDGSLSRVEALQNVGKATVWGAQALAEVWLSRWLSIYSIANWVNGKETDDSKNEQVPLRHAPPFYGSSGIRYSKHGFSADVTVQYNSTIRFEDLAPSEQAKPTIYAKDTQGRPYSPGWYALHAKVGYQWKRMLLSVGWENITNQRYRTYSSGIVAPGSNLVCSIRYHW